MSGNVAGKRKRQVRERKMVQEVPKKEEEQPNKAFSFIVGICIGIAIIALFVLLFPN